MVWQTDPLDPIVVGSSTISRQIVTHNPRQTIILHPAALSSKDDPLANQSTMLHLPSFADLSWHGSPLVCGKRLFS